MKSTKLTHEEVLVVDKITYEAKITDFELRNTPTGRQYFWDGENSEKLNIKDGLQFICDAACYGFDFALEFGLTQQEIDTWNAMIDRFGLSDEFKAEDFKEREILRVRESTRKQAMKRLNITKEAFQKSRYFTNKYGKLEYVLESGNLFKTNKGKVLMFKEGLFSDLGDSIDSGISGVRKFFHGKPKFKEGDSVMLCMIEWYPGGVHHGGTIVDVKWGDNKWYYKVDFGEYSDADWWPEDALAVDSDPKAGNEKLDKKALIEKYPEFIKRAKIILGKKTRKELGIDESTKKFGNSTMKESKMKKLNITKEQFEKSKYFKDKYGRLEYVSESGKVFKTNKGNVLKFKESSNVKDEPYSVYKFINTLRWDYNEYMLEEPKELEETGDGWKQISIMCSKSQYRKMLGVVKEYCQKYGWEYQSNKIDDDVFEIIVSEWDESTLTDDFRESTKKFGRKFKESVGDVSTDPAYVCPYCGSTNCEFDDAENSPNEGYFHGATLNAQFWCNDCDKPYNVTYELKVKDVYPNEDADKLSDDWA